MELDKDHLLNKSETFCMFPWLHLNVTPSGDVFPCCSGDYKDPYGNTHHDSLENIINNDRMKQLRLDMLNGKKNKICDYCYRHEKSSPFSFRNYSKEHFGHLYDELIPQTHDNGYIDNWKMRYFDIRFSNICNFKCRTCGAEFSSKWAQEEKATDDWPANKPIMKHADESGKLLEEVMRHVEHMDLAYFAGGEPLITDEHYTILEEMIRTGANERIVLRYNSNVSNFKYKKYDIIDLWSKFKRVEISASLDHYGSRAEYIRHGTVWSEVEENLLKIREIPYIDFQFNCVLSIFNYVTLADFLEYLMKKGLYRQKDNISIYRLMNPAHYNSQVLPKHLKDVGTEKLINLQKKLESKNYWSIQQIEDSIKFANAADLWEEQKYEFQHQTERRDKYRNERFNQVFPELKGLVDDY